MLIPLTKGYIAVIDDEDAHLANFKWFAAVRNRVGRPPTVYAGRYIDGKAVFLHQCVLPCENGAEPDHIDGDGLNNRRDNLRPSLRRQNSMNSPSRGGTSKYKGVFFQAHANRWRAQISVGAHTRHLGYFRNEEDAAKAYDVAAIQAVGTFARLNFRRTQC